MTGLAHLGMVFETRGADTTNRQLDGIATNSGRAERATDALTASVKRQQMAMGAIKWASGLLSVAALTAALVALRRATLDYSASLSEISTLVDTSTVSMDQLSQAAIRQAGQFNSSPLTQTAALYQIISAGASTAAQATDLLTAANRLAVGGVTTVAIAADGLTSVLNAYGDRAGGATAVSDALFVAMRSGKTTVAELSSSLGQVAPLAAQVGVSFDELAGATAALTKGGISTSVAVTGLRAILAAVAKPSSEAEKMAKALGLQFNSTALASKGLSGFLADLQARTGGNTDALALLFGGVEALVPIMALSGQAGKDFAAIMEDMGTKTGATGEAFERVATGPAYQLGVIFSTLSANALQFGTNVLNFLSPAISSLTGIVTGATQPHWALDLAMKAVAITAGVLLAQALYSTVAAAVLASPTILAFAASAAIAGPAAAAASVGVTALGAAINFALGPIGWAVAAVGLLSGAWVLAEQRSNGMSASLNKQIDSAGAAGAEYRRLRQETEASIPPMSHFGRTAEQAADGLRVATVEASALKREMIALGIETQHTTMQLALLAVNEAEGELISARGARPQGVNNRRDDTGAATLRVSAAERRLIEAQKSFERAEAAFSDARRAAGARASGGAGVDAAAQALRDAAAARAAALAAAQGAGEASSPRSQAESDYKRLIEQSQAFRDNLTRERAELGLTATEQMRLRAAAQARLLVSQGETVEAVNLANAILEEAKALGAATEAYERNERVKAGTASLESMLTGLERQAQLIGQSAEAQARLNAEWAIADLSLKDITPEMKVLIDQIAELAFANEQASRHNPLRDMADELRLIDSLARDAGQGMASAFGDAGRAMGGLLTTMSSYQSRLAEIALAQQQGSLTGAQAARERASAEVQAYGDSLSAAKSFFREGSDGYKLLEGAERAYRMVQFAMSVQAMLMGGQETAATVGQNAIKAMSHGVVAVARALASLPFPLNIAAGAATIAALAAIGIRIAGGGGGSKGPSGTGTGFDPAASAERARGQAQTAQSGQQAFAASVAQRVEVKITADRDGLNAYVVGTAEKVAGPIARQESAQMGRQVLDASRRSAPGMQQQQRRLGTT